MIPCWIVAAPVWGAAYRTLFIELALPALRAAVEVAGESAALDPATVEIAVYGPQDDAIARAAGGCRVSFRAAPSGGDKYRQLGDVHRDALQRAPAGSYVMLATADMIVSREVFLACARHFSAGTRAVVVAPSRSLRTADLAPGLSARSLLAWSMANMHAFTREAFYGGRASPPSTFRFRRGDDIVLRGFHLHPLALVKDRPLSFAGTPDQDLLGNFAAGEIHVVTDCDEMAAAEISPRTLKPALARRPWRPEDIAAWATAHCAPVNWWLARHRIVLTGVPHDGDRAVFDRVLAAAPLPAAA